MRIGVDYYPEHWPEEVWEQDADRMQDAGGVGGANGRICLESSGAGGRCV